jgi:hypothetical protein
MSGSVETGSSTTTGNNKDVNALTSTLAKGLKGAYQPGGTTYVAPSSTTQNSWQQALGAAGNQNYAGGLSGALSSYGNRATGAELSVNDPLYAQQRATLTDDVLKTVNGQFASMGQLGSDQSRQSAARGLADALGGLDTQQRTESYGLQSQAADKLSSLYQASLLPSSVTGAVGAAQDADAQAKQNGKLDYMAKFMEMLNGASGAAGTKTTTETPWWKIGLGTAATAAGM